MLTTVTQVGGAKPQMKAFFSLTKPSLRVLMTLVTWFSLKIKLFYVVKSLVATCIVCQCFSNFNMYKQNHADYDLEDLG